jgi:YebC/PmpR family DNA-binding regulatory protein
VDNVLQRRRLLLSGHSKWANIKRQKAVVDAKKGAVYARMSREIIVAAKLGGGDINANFKLRQAVDRAKAEGVPNDNIARAIEKGAGSGAGGNMEELIYEGYGPGGVAVMVRCATDNRNRTAGDVRSYFSKYSGNLGESGCVSWIFKERGEVCIAKSKSLNEDSLLNAALELGADDIDNSSDEMVVVVCPPLSVTPIRDGLKERGFQVLSADATFSAQSTVEVEDKETAKQLMRLLDLLENQEDVQQVYANFDMDPTWMQEFLG